MSKLKLFRETENAVPTGASFAGNVYFTEQQNLYIINNAGEKAKFSDVVFAANQAALGALTQKFQNKIYVAIAEGTLWRYNGSAWYQLNNISVDVFGAVKNEELLGDANDPLPEDSLWEILNKMHTRVQTAQLTAESKMGPYANIVDISGTTLTIDESVHAGKWLRFTNAAGCTVEMNATLPNGFQCMLYKDVAGGSVHFSGDADFINPSASIEDEFATVHALVIGGKVKFKGDFV